MGERKWHIPLDSRFLFTLLKNITQLEGERLYERLLLDSNEGQSFEGRGNRVKSCWWPDHEKWFYIALSFFEGDDEELYNEHQRFPLPKNPRAWEKIAKWLNKRDQKSDAMGQWELNYKTSQIEHQLTFESHVFSTLKSELDRAFSDKEGEKKAFIQKTGEEEGLPPYEINRIAELGTVDEILAYLVTQAKENRRKPLTIPFPDFTVNENEEVKEWQILAANELKMDPMDVSARIMENDRDLYHQLPGSVAGNQRQWADVFISFPNFCKFLVDAEGVIQGNFSAIGLTREQERRMQQGRFVDEEIDVCFCDPLHAPGDHVLYLLNLSVNREVELERYYALWNELVALLKKCAKEGVYFTRIYYKAFLPEHRAMMIGRGFRFLCNDIAFGGVFVHEMNPNSTLRVMDEELASLYRERKNQRGRAVAVSNDGLEAEDGFRNMFRMIDELFRHPRLAEMKPYFFSNIELPEDENQRQLGIATAELLRDILQYAKNLLDYLNEDFSRTYDDYYEMIMESALVRAGIEQYQFATEHPNFKVKKLGIDQVNAKDIVNFAMIWIDLDKLFVMRDDTLKLRPYFYELRDSLPGEDEIPLATALVIRLLSAMKISESLLERIPNHLVISYNQYKNMVKSIRIVQEVVTRNQFLKEELKW